MLLVSISGGFIPAAGQTFTWVDAGTIGGGFTNVRGGWSMTTADGLRSFAVHSGSGCVFGSDKVVLAGFSDATASALAPVVRSPPVVTPGMA